MISTFKEGDVSIWVPVAKGKNGGPARAFLPFNGHAGTYRYGYKAAPSKSIGSECLILLYKSIGSECLISL